VCCSRWGLVYRWGPGRSFSQGADTAVLVAATNTQAANSPSQTAFSLPPLLSLRADAISELGRFYQAKGPRARLDTSTRDSILAHLAAVEAGLPEEEKSLLGF
jgi:hypothetical protein